MVEVTHTLTQTENNIENPHRHTFHLPSSVCVDDDVDDDGL